MKDFNVYRLFYPRRKVKLTNPVLVCLDGIWICGPKDLMLLNGNIVFASEHLVFYHLSNDALLHLIEQTSKYDLSLQLVRTYVHLVLKIQNHLYVNTLTLYQHSQICEVTVCFETNRWHMCQLRKKSTWNLHFLPQWAKSEARLSEWWRWSKGSERLTPG